MTPPGIPRSTTAFDFSLPLSRKIKINIITLHCLGSRIQKLTDVKIDDPGTVRSLAEKTTMVRAARQLLSAITKVLILADRIVVKQLLTAKEKVHGLCNTL